MERTCSIGRAEDLSNIVKELSQYTRNNKLNGVVN